MSLSIEQILEYEALTMGRPCKLLDSAVLSEGDTVVTAVLYQPEPHKPERRELRVVVYSGDRQLFSSIAANFWAASGVSGGER